MGETTSRVMMEGLHSCANCHSASRDGKTMGMDVDGPRNDKALYAIFPIQPQASIRSENVVAWSTFRGKLGGKLRVGFMSQVSPDGRWMVFSSKSWSPHTQMFLTHIDEEGNDSPAIDPEEPMVRNSLGVALVRTGKIEEALKLSPDYAEAGRFSEAAATTRRALSAVGTGVDPALIDDLKARIAEYEARVPAVER